MDYLLRHVFKSAAMTVGVWGVSSNEHIVNISEKIDAYSTVDAIYRYFFVQRKKRTVV